MIMDVSSKDTYRTRVTIVGTASTAGPARARMTLAYATQGERVPVDVVLTESEIFVKVPAEMKKAAGGKRWGRQSLADVAEAAGIDVEQLLAESRRGNPKAWLDGLLASGDAREVGPELVRDVPTTRFTGTVSADAVAATYRELAPSQLVDAAKVVDAQTSFDLWLGADGLPRRLRQTTKYGESEVDLAFEFLEYGVQLDVSPPPARDTTSLRSLLDNLALAE
jgi:hypothetical protein